MKNISNIEDLITIDNSVVRAKKNYIKPSILVMLGVASIILGQKFEEMDSIMMALVFGGVILALWGIIQLFLPTKKMQYAATQEPLNKYVFFYDYKDVDLVEHNIAEGNYKQLDSLRTNKKHCPLMSEVYSTSNGSFSIAQHFRFDKYYYEPAGEPIITKK